MWGLVQLLIIIAVMGALAFQRAPLWLWSSLLLLVVVALTVIGSIHGVVLFVVWAAVLALLSVLNWPSLRRKTVTGPLLAFFRRSMPPMSVTERDAIEAGDVWWEADIFSGNPDWDKLHAIPAPQLTAEEQAYLDNEVNTLCRMIDDWEITHEVKDLPSEVWEYIKTAGFWSLIIPKEYGGKGFSALAHSAVVARIASRSVSVAVTVMVPNSLGPGELLLEYGTDAQKQYYLPRLASGQDIPCFGLTEPGAGSDAGSLESVGVVCQGEWEGKTVTGIRLNWDKRYITLSPIATVLGLAFRLLDPDGLLGKQEDMGITLCLIPTSHPGVVVGDRHYPLDSAFLNGPTYGKDVFIPMDWIIGGQEMAGQGWRMLMEALAVGRSISLPALSAGMSQLSCRMTGAYARIREQFGVAIGHFEGVQEALARVGGLTYMLNSMRLLTLTAVEEGKRPAIASAMAKYHMTELGRQVINDSMDIHGGRAIILGPRNYLGRNYEAVPISITVEGANILTRNLIIFGQGAIRCHPYIYQEMQAAQLSDPEKRLVEFDKLIFSHVGHVVTQMARSFVFALTGGRGSDVPDAGGMEKHYRQLNRLSASFSLVADVTMMVFGGALKRRERLSARLGDILSYLYMASGVLKYFNDQNRPETDRIYVDWCVEYCLHQAQNAFDDLLANLGKPWLARVLRFWVFPLGKPYRAPSDSLEARIAESLLAPSKMRDRLTQECYLGEKNGDITQVLEKALAAVVAAEGPMKKLRAEIRQGHVAKSADLAVQIQQAKEKGLLSEAEITALQAAEALTRDAVAVDAFPADYFNQK